MDAANSTADATGISSDEAADSRTEIDLPKLHRKQGSERGNRIPTLRGHTPGGIGVNYPRLVPMTREIDLATMSFERAGYASTIPFGRRSDPVCHPEGD
jgi:hypothetical protein